MLCSTSVVVHDQYNPNSPLVPQCQAILPLDKNLLVIGIIGEWFTSWTQSSKPILPNKPHGFPHSLLTSMKIFVRLCTFSVHASKWASWPLMLAAHYFHTEDLACNLRWLNVQRVLLPCQPHCMSLVVPSVVASTDSHIIQRVQHMVFPHPLSPSSGLSQDLTLQALLHPHCTSLVAPSIVASSNSCIVQKIQHKVFPHPLSPSPGLSNIASTVLSLQLSTFYGEICIYLFIASLTFNQLCHHARDEGIQRHPFLHPLVQFLLMKEVATPSALKWGVVTTVTSKTVAIFNLDMVRKAHHKHLWEFHFTLVGTNKVQTPGYKLILGSGGLAQWPWRYGHSKSVIPLQQFCTFY